MVSMSIVLSRRRGEREEPNMDRNIDAPPVPPTSTKDHAGLPNMAVAPPPSRSRNRSVSASSKRHIGSVEDDSDIQVLADAPKFNQDVDLKHSRCPFHYTREGATRYGRGGGKSKGKCDAPDVPFDNDVISSHSDGEGPNPTQRAKPKPNGPVLRRRKVAVLLLSLHRRPDVNPSPRHLDSRMRIVIKIDTCVRRTASVNS